MKSPSDNVNTQNTDTDTDINKIVNAALEQSVRDMPADSLSDISQVRKIALAKLERKSNSPQVFKLLLSNSFFKITAPIAVAILVTISIKSHNVETIPALPSALVNVEIPTEDLALLEDLDFVTWLAENEQDALL